MNSSNLLLNHLEKANKSNTSQKLLNDLVKESMERKDKANYKDVEEVKEEINTNVWSQTNSINQRSATNKRSIVIDLSNTPCEEKSNQDWGLLWDEEESLEWDNKFKLPSSLIKSTNSEIISDVSKYIIDPHSLTTRHPEINHYMKILLLDWMNEVCAEFDLRRETYYKSLINILILKWYKI